MEEDTLFEPTRQETLDIEQENLKYSLTMKSNKDIIIFLKIMLFNLILKE